MEMSAFAGADCKGSIVINTELQFISCFTFSIISLVRRSEKDCLVVGSGITSHLQILLIIIVTFTIFESFISVCPKLAIKYI